jgi:succinate dehydrogenase / fumarate reductase cytochrome b subunit
MEVLQHPLSKLVWLGLLWAFLHHFCAGIRYLAIDLRWASSLKMARASSQWVMGVSLLLTVLIGAKLW